MSTFGGKIQEIPGISVDRFDKNNYDSEVYFLSHCHTDHMVGLSYYTFQDFLVTSNKFIYTSDISCAILKKKHSYIKNNIKVLDMYKPTLICLKVRNITVTPLPAGHCPGSVMFLFETDVYILYTGDYRINKSDIKKFRSFYDSFDKIKAIEKIYLDTTFFLKDYLKFPSRGDSLKELCKIIKEWIDKGKNYVVKLITSANYGYEYVYNEIYQRIGMPVHVNSNAYDIHSLIPEMDNSVTLDDGITQIHSNCGDSYQSICNKSSTGDVRSIKVSAFRWTQNNLENGLSCFESNVYYVCYSTHASYEEGLELIRFLKPKSIEACVTHDNPYVNLELSKSIEDILKEFYIEGSLENTTKLFEINHTEKVPDSLESNCSSFKDEFGILNSPPRESGKNLLREEVAKTETTKRIMESLKTEGEFSKISFFETLDIKDKIMEGMSSGLNKLEAAPSVGAVESLSFKPENTTNEKGILNELANESKNVENLEPNRTEEICEENEATVYNEVFWYLESPQDNLPKNEPNTNMESIESSEELGAKETSEKICENTPVDLESELDLADNLWVLGPPHDVKEKREDSIVSTTDVEKQEKIETIEGTRKKPKLSQSKTDAPKNNSEKSDNGLKVLKDTEWILDDVKNIEPEEDLKKYELNLGHEPEKDIVVISDSDSEASSYDDILILGSPPRYNLKNSDNIGKQEVVDMTEDVILDIINTP